MTTFALAETRMRPASALLEGRLSAGAAVVGPVTAELDLLAVEQQAIAVETTALIARMDDPALSIAALDRLTGRLTALLVRAEDVRVARARAAARRAGDERRWRDHLDLD